MSTPPRALRSKSGFLVFGFLGIPAMVAAAVAAASVLGIIVGQVLWAGDLFGMGADMQPEYIP